MGVWRGSEVTYPNGLCMECGQAVRPALLLAGCAGGGTRTAAYVFGVPHEQHYKWAILDEAQPKVVLSSHRESSGFIFHNVAHERRHGSTIIHVTRDPAAAIRTIARKFQRLVPEGWSPADYWVYVNAEIEPHASARVKVEDLGVRVGGADQYKADAHDPGPFNPYSDPRVEDMARRYGYLREAV